MAKEIKQLAIVNPVADTNTIAFSQSQPGIFIVSVSANNRDLVDQRVSIWAYNSASVSNPGYIASGKIVPGRETYTTEKFTLHLNDQIHIRSTSASVSFLISGVNQTEV